MGASFSLKLEGDHIADVSFRSTTCITLVAYCECLAEMVEGLTLRDAVVASSGLSNRLSGVPIMKQHRAALAGSAFLAAVQEALAARTRQESSAGSQPTSRPNQELTGP